MKNLLGFELKGIKGGTEQSYTIGEQGQVWPIIISTGEPYCSQARELFIEASVRQCTSEQFHQLFIDSAFNLNTHEELLTRIKSWPFGGEITAQGEFPVDGEYIDKWVKQYAIVEYNTVGEMVSLKVTQLMDFAQLMQQQQREAMKLTESFMDGWKARRNRDVIGTVTITDAETIEAMETGSLTGVSIGYSVDHDFEIDNLELSTEVAHFQNLVQSSEDKDVVLLCQLLAKVPVIELCHLPSDLLGAIVAIAKEEK